LMTVALVATKSRGGYLGFITATAVLGVPFVRSVRFTVTRVAVGVGIAVLLSTLPSVRRLPGAVWRRAASSANFEDVSVRRHLDLWAVAAAVALAHPLMGTGQETFPEAFSQYSSSVLGAPRAGPYEGIRAESPHNVYLSVAAGAGLPALLAYLAVIAAVFGTIVGEIKTRRQDWTRLALVSVTAAAAAHIVTDAFMTAEVTSSWLFWVLMGAGLGICQGENTRRSLDASGRSSAH
jgi:O-antigen ligase